jgi:hypothetical protein
MCRQWLGNPQVQAQSQANRARFVVHGVPTDPADLATTMKR